MSAPWWGRGPVATLDMTAQICTHQCGLSLTAPHFHGWAPSSHITWFELLMQHHWSCWHCASPSPDVVDVLCRLCCWRASWTTNSSEQVVIAFYRRSVLDLKLCLSNEKLPKRYGNISLAKLLSSKSGFCVNIKPFIYNESISAATSSSYFNVICQEHVLLYFIHIERNKLL